MYSKNPLQKVTVRFGLFKASLFVTASELLLGEGEDCAAGGLEWAKLGQRWRQDDLGVEARGDQLGLQEGRIALPAGKLVLGHQGALGQQPAAQRGPGEPQ